MEGHHTLYVDFLVMISMVELGWIKMNSVSLWVLWSRLSTWNQSTEFFPPITCLYSRMEVKWNRSSAQVELVYGLAG
jgi:hypothetical protein